VPFPKKLFLSHASPDRSFVNKLATFLKKRKIPFWYSKRNLLGAQQWHDEIGKALRSCDWFLLVLSPAAVKSKWVKRELMYALRGDRYENRIIPLLYKSCDEENLSWTLAGLQRVDFSKGFDKSCRELIKIWSID
jgi:TIR domain